MAGVPSPCLQETESPVSDSSRNGSKRLRGGGGAQVVLLKVGQFFFGRKLLTFLFGVSC